MKSSFADWFPVLIWLVLGGSLLYLIFRQVLKPASNSYGPRPHAPYPDYGPPYWPDRFHSSRYEGQKAESAGWLGGFAMLLTGMVSVGFLLLMRSGNDEQDPETQPTAQVKGLSRTRELPPGVPDYVIPDNDPLPPVRYKDITPMDTVAPLRLDTEDFSGQYVIELELYTDPRVSERLLINLRRQKIRCAYYTRTADNLPGRGVVVGPYYTAEAAARFQKEHGLSGTIQRVPAQ